MKPNCLVKQLNYNIEKIKSYQDNTVTGVYCDTYIKFDPVQDLAIDNVDFIVLFMFYGQRSQDQQVNGEIFDSYLGILNLKQHKWIKGLDYQGYFLKF